MRKNTFIISQMDCPSEEQMIRMKLDSYDQIKCLDFDMPNRKLEVSHSGAIDEILSSILELKFSEKVLRKEVAEFQL